MVVSSKEGRPCRIGSAEAEKQIEFTGWACPDLPDAPDPNTEDSDYEGEDTNPE